MADFVNSTPVEDKIIIQIPNKDSNSSKEFKDIPVTVVYAKTGDEAGRATGIKFSAKTVFTAAELRFITNNFSQIMGYSFDKPEEAKE
jgi:hypothetical protein